MRKQSMLFILIDTLFTHIFLILVKNWEREADEKDTRATNLPFILIFHWIYSRQFYLPTIRQSTATFFWWRHLLEIDTKSFRHFECFSRPQNYDKIYRNAIKSSYQVFINQFHRNLPSFPKDLLKLLPKSKYYSFHNHRSMLMVTLITLYAIWNLMWIESKNRFDTYFIFYCINA